MTAEFRDFQDILTDLDEGRVHDELTHQLREVVRAVRSSQRAGKLTLTVDIKMDGRQFILNASVKPTIPTPKPGITMFFADDDGDLRKDDPKQVPLKNIGEQPRVIREVNFDINNKGA